jgi:hypothetical protein
MAGDMQKLHSGLKNMSSCMKHMTEDMNMKPEEARTKCVNMLRQNLKSKK